MTIQTRVRAAAAALVLLFPPAAQAAGADPAAALEAAMAQAPNVAPARNVILFIGDGMGVSTVTAARILEGQRAGGDGPSANLAFETLSSGGLVRTYSQNALVTDSANGASAITTGVRTVNGALGVDGATTRGVCEPARFVATLAERAKREQGRAVGVVSTASITDATPAAFYAHAADRDWHDDTGLPPAARAAGCVDIASQLVEAPDDVRMDVALGGGLAHFVPAISGGAREDGRDLVAAWKARDGGVFVQDLAGLQAAAAQDRPILGLFAADHMLRESARAAEAPQVPTLAQMTAAAITRLSRAPRGYVLLVEGAHIDKAHHRGLVAEALNEAIELSKAVAVARDLTDAADTLILVTADHSHGLVINGGDRDDPVLGLIRGSDDEPPLAGDGKPMPILTYATGPGGPAAGAARPDDTGLDIAAADHVRQAGVLLGSAAHAGEDVPAYAGGPAAYLVRGSMDQPYLFQVMRHALRLPPAPPPAR